MSFSPPHLWKQSSNNNSFSSIIENDSDKNCSILSQNSNKGFSIKDILPDVSFTTEQKHQRVKSHTIEALSPQMLFSHIRKYSKVSYHEKKHSSLLPEIEEMNSTRMQTSQSRRISEFEALKESNIQIDRENFCKHCKKCVNPVFEIGNVEKFENFVLNGLNTLFSNLCWCPEWINRLKVKVCEECKNEL